jgi:hypothetical protein
VHCNRSAFLDELPKWTEGVTMARPTTDAASETLSILGTVLGGYRAAARRFASFLVLIIVWTVLGTGTGYLVEEVTHARSDLPVHYTFPALMRAEAADLASYAELLLSASLVAIAVYRAIILDEKPRWDAALRIGRREMRFLALAILFSVPAHLGVEFVAVAVHFRAAPALLTQALAIIGIPIFRRMSLVLLAHLLVSIGLTPFVGLAFPLIALGAPRGTLRQSLRLGRNHRLRLAAIGFLASLPIIPLSYAFYFVAMPDTVPIVVVQSIVGIFVGLLAEALVTGVFAVAFQRITAHSNKGTYDVFD